MNKDSRLVTIMSNLDNLKTTYENLKKENEAARKSGDFDKVVNAPSNIDVKNAQNRYETAQNIIKEYKEMLENWQDGKKYTLETGEWQGSEFETTTLPNGQKGCVFEKIENGQKVKYYFNLEIDNDFGHVGLLGDMVERVVVEE